MKQLIQLIEDIIPLDAESKTALQHLAEKATFRKNEFILEPGQYCDKIWFLETGMVRKFYYHDGKDMTLWIHTENDFFTSLTSYAQQTRAEEYLQACEDCSVIYISRKNSQKLGHYPQIMTFTNELMQREFAKIDIHSKAFNNRDAKGRYEYLKNIAPEIIKRAKLGHIASLIGVTQETLSRIRSRH